MARKFLMVPNLRRRSPFAMTNFSSVLASTTTGTKPCCAIAKCKSENSHPEDQPKKPGQTESGSCRARTEYDVHHVAKILFVGDAFDGFRRKFHERAKMLSQPREEFRARARFKFVAPQQRLQRQAGF